MLIFNSKELKKIVSNYGQKIVEHMSDPDFYTGQEGDFHTEYIHRCARGDVDAREYVKKKIKDSLIEQITDVDKERAYEIVKKEVERFNSKDYKRYDLTNIDGNKEMLISYYQLCETALSEKQKIEALSYKTDINVIDIIVNQIYKNEYAAGVIEDLIQMRVNNIEVHDVKKIRVETLSGNWFTVEDLNYDDELYVKTTARRLLSQESGSDITDEECEREGMLVDGSRITVVLKPGAAINYIFVKKFDGLNITNEEMLQNGTVTEELIEDLTILTKGRANTIIIGGVNTGKSTFSKLFCGLYPKHFKIGVVDSSKDTDFSLLYPDRDIVTLYETATYDLNAQFSKLLRTNRHILMISEIRSFEAEQMIKAMGRGQAGSFCTLHSSNAELAVDNIGYMCQESGIQQDMRVLRSRIASAVDIIIRIRHFENTGKRAVDSVSELYATNNIDKPFDVRSIYEWDNDNMKLVRNSNYELSETLEGSLRYYGCNDDDIKKLRRIP